jgi:hypothetical protein
MHLAQFRLRIPLDRIFNDYLRDCPQKPAFRFKKILKTLEFQYHAPAFKLQRIHDDEKIRTVI